MIEEIKIGSVYIKATCANPTIKKVNKIEDGIVYYDYLHGPMKSSKVGQSRIKKFLNWATEEIPEEKSESNYKKYCGAKIKEPHLILSMCGKPLLKCTPEKARYYLRKNLAVSINETTHQLITSELEDRFAKLYGGTLNPFFLETKNDKCVVCGATMNLTRHHIIPKRHKPHFLKSKLILSNVLFVCEPCHKKYEKHQPKEGEIDVNDPYAWKNHFISIMNPKYIPIGWDIVLKFLQKDNHEIA
jgi:5-methylcytosine-specific restriction endonuclease McrA